MIDLCRQLRGLYRSMLFVGFVTDWDDSQEVFSTTGERKGGDPYVGDGTETRVAPREGSSVSKSGSWWRRCYCYVVCCFFWLRLLAYLPCFWVGLEFKPDLLPLRVAVAIWLASCALNVTTILHAFLSRNHLSSFSGIWNSLAPDYDLTQTVSNSGEKRPSYADVTATKRLKKTEGFRKFQTLSRNVDIEVVDEERGGSVRKSEQKSPRQLSSRQPFQTKPDQLTVQMPTHIVRRESLQSSLGSGSTKDMAIDLSTSSLSMAFFESDSNAGSAQRAWEKPVSSLNATVCCEDPDSKEKGVREPARRYEIQVRKIGRMYTITAWIVVFVNVSGTVSFFLLESVVPQVKPVQTVLLNPFGSSLTVRIVFVFFFFFNACAWILPPSFCCALCSILCVRFKMFSDLLRDGLARCGEEFPPEMELWRHEHLRLCQSVSILDRTMRLMVMSAYTTCLPLCIFLLYSLVSDHSVVVTVITSCFWLFVNFSTMFVISVHAAAVHEAAHSPLDSLFFVRADKADASQLAQLQLFLSKLTGPAIGFTALGIVTVTKEMILTLGGLLLTYFMVLVDYQV